MKTRKSERPRPQPTPKVTVRRRQIRLAQWDELEFDEQGHLEVIRSRMVEVGEDGWPIDLSRRH